MVMSITAVPVNDGLGTEIRTSFQPDDWHEPPTAPQAGGLSWPVEILTRAPGEGGDAVRDGSETMSCWLPDAETDRI